MAKNKRKDKNRPGKLQRRARRDVRLAIDPVLDEIRRAQRSAGRDYEQNAERVADIYGALGDEIRPLGGQYDTQAQRISGDLNTVLGGLAGLLGPSMEAFAGLSPEDAAGAQAQLLGAAAPEGQAAVNMFGALGAGGQSLLANDRSRNLGYQTSAQRQVGLDRSALEKSFLQDYRDLLDDIKQQRLDVMQDVPSQIMARLDELRDRKKQFGIARAELRNRQKLAEAELAERRKQFNYGRRQNNRQMDFAESEIDRRQNKKQIKNLNQDIRGLKAQRRPVAQELRQMEKSRTPGELAHTNYDEKLRRRKRGYTQKIRKKRKRRRSLT